MRTKMIKRMKQHDQRRERSLQSRGRSLDRIAVLEMRGLARRYIEWPRRRMRGWHPNYRSMRKRPRISCSSEIGLWLSHDQGSWSENEHDQPSCNHLSRLILTPHSEERQQTCPLPAKSSCTFQIYPETCARPTFLDLRLLSYWYRCSGVHWDLHWSRG